MLTSFCIMLPPRKTQNNKIKFNQLHKPSLNPNHTTGQSHTRIIYFHIQNAKSIHQRSV